MKEKSGDRQSSGRKLLEGLEQAGERSDSCFRDYIGQLCGEWRSHELRLPQLPVLLALSATHAAWPRKPL